MFDIDTPFSYGRGFDHLLITSGNIQDKRKYCVWSKMQILHLYLVGQNRNQGKWVWTCKMRFRDMCPKGLKYWNLLLFFSIIWLCYSNLYSIAGFSIVFAHRPVTNRYYNTIKHDGQRLLVFYACMFYSFSGANWHFSVGCHMRTLL